MRPRSTPSTWPHESPRVSCRDAVVHAQARRRGLYALLKLPDMPELRKRAKAAGKRGKDWMTAFAFERRDVKTGTIKYADAKRRRRA